MVGKDPEFRDDVMPPQVGEIGSILKGHVKIKYMYPVIFVSNTLKKIDAIKMATFKI